MTRDTLKILLADMAKLVDEPAGAGGGAILLEALAAIEALERDLAAAQAAHATRTTGELPWTTRPLPKRSGAASSNRRPRTVA